MRNEYQASEAMSAIAQADESNQAKFKAWKAQAASNQATKGRGSMSHANAVSRGLKSRGDRRWQNHSTHPLAHHSSRRRLLLGYVRKYIQIIYIRELRLSY